MSRLARPNVLKMVPYQPGKPISEVQRELGLTEVVKLASNENPIGPSPRAIQAAAAALSSVHLYPDGAAFHLRSALAGHYGLPLDCFAVGNGSDELIQFLGLAYLGPGTEVVIGNPSFVRYDATAELNDVKLHRIPLTADHRHDLPAMASAVNENTRFVFIANPNNPTGTTVTRAELETFLADMPPQVITVLDEAYFEYVDEPDFPDATAYIETHNVVVLRTFSKAYGLAGLRVGYALARPEFLDPLNRVREPFNVNSVAMEAAVAALDDADHLALARRVNSEGKEAIYAFCRDAGLPFVPSQANFVLIDTLTDGAAIYEAMLREGVIVRPCKAFGLPSFIRVSIGAADELARFFTAFTKALSASPVA